MRCGTGVLNGRAADRTVVVQDRPGEIGVGDTPPRHIVNRVAFIAAVCAVVVALMVLTVDDPPWSLGVGLSLGWLAIAAEIDRRTERLPNRLVGAALVPVMAVVVAASAVGRPGVFASAVIGAVLLGLPIAVLHAASPAAMGFGDVKAALVAGAALGLLEPRLALPTAALAAGTGLVTAFATRRARIPFGPHLVSAAVVVGVVWTTAVPEGSPWR